MPADIQTHTGNGEPQIDVSLFQLIDAFKRVLDKKLPGVQLRFRLEKWSVKEKTEYVLMRLREKTKLLFQELFDEDRTISEFIVTFLALLELVHLGLAKVFQPTPLSDIYIVRSFDENGSKGDG